MFENLQRPPQQQENHKAKGPAGPCGPDPAPFLPVSDCGRRSAARKGHGLRCAPGPRARKLFPAARGARWENFAPGPCTSRPRLAQISSARRQKNGRQRPSPKGTTEMTDTIAVGSHSLWRNLTRNGEQWRIRQVGETKRRLGSVWTLHVWHGVVAAGLDAESRGRFWVYDVDCVSTDRSVGQSGWRAVDRAGWSACTSHTGRASIGRSRGHHPGRCRRCTTRPRS